jgi:hypothetical protein
LAATTAGFFVSGGALGARRTAMATAARRRVTNETAGSFLIFNLCLLSLPKGY